MKIGPYEIEGEIARGGQGVVFRARDPISNQPVAIKVLSERQDERQRKRFQREAQALGKLDHPNIVRVLNVGEDRGQAYLVLEFVEGPSLQDRLDREGPLTPPEAARITRDVANAVQFAHGLSIVHRDIKPSNVLMRGETPLLTDFGLARELDAPLSGSVSVQGRFMGTPGFCPPEQARGELDRLGPPADVYGLGALLYALLTSDPPFVTESLLELLVATVETPPLPPSSRGVDVHPDLEAVCLRCLEKAPEDRYTSAWELSQDLERVLAGRAPGWRSSQTNPTLPPRLASELPPVSPARVVAAVVIGLLLLAALGGGVAIGLIAILDSGEEVAATEPIATPGPVATPAPQAAWDAGALAALQREADRVTPYHAPLAARFATLAAQAGEHRPAVETAFVDYLIRRGRYRDAQARFRLVHRLGLSTPTLRLLEAFAQYEQALAKGERPTSDALEALARDLPDTGAAQVAGAILANAHGRYAEGARLARLARTQAASLGIAWAEEVRARSGDRDFEQARALSADALREHPADPQVLARAAQVEMFSARHARSIELIERCLSLFGDRPPRHYSVAAAVIYGTAGRNREALERIARLDPAREDCALQLRASLALQNLGRLVEARRLSMRFYEADRKAFRRVARKLLEPKQARMLFETLKALGRSRLDAPSSLSFRIGLVGPQVEPTMVQRAGQAPSAARPPLLRALLLAAQGELWADLKPSLEAARAAAPRSPTVAIEYARLAVGRDEFTDARAALARAREVLQGATSWEVERLEAKLETQAGMLVAARARLSEVARKASQVERLLARARLKILSADLTEARRLLEEALRQEPDHVDAQSALIEVLSRLAPKAALAKARALHERIGASDERLMTSWIVAAMEQMFLEFGRRGMNPRLIAAGVHLAQETEYLFLISAGAAARLRICDQYLRFPQLQMLPSRVPQWLLETLQEADRRDPSRSSAPLLIGMLGVRMGKPPKKILRLWRKALRRQPTMPEPVAFTKLFLRRYPEQEAALRELWPR